MELALAFFLFWNTLSVFISRWLRRSCDFPRFYFFKIPFTEIVTAWLGE